MIFNSWRLFKKKKHLLKSAIVFDMRHQCELKSHVQRSKRFQIFGLDLMFSLQMVLVNLAGQVDFVQKLACCPITN